MFAKQNKTKQNQPPNNKFWKTSESIAHSFLMLELRCVEVHANDDTLSFKKQKCLSCKGIFQAEA